MNKDQPSGLHAIPKFYNTSIFSNIPSKEWVDSITRLTSTIHKQFTRGGLYLRHYRGILDTNTRKFQLPRTRRSQRIDLTFSILVMPILCTRPDGNAESGNFESTWWKRRKSEKRKEVREKRSIISSEASIKSREMTPQNGCLPCCGSLLAFRRENARWLIWITNT